MRILCLVVAVICAASVVAEDAATQAAKTAAGYVGEDVRALVDGAMSSSLPDMVIDDSASSHHSSGDSGAAAGTAAAARCRSKDAATDPKCVGVGLATHSESWGDRYPMTRQDKIFTSGVLSQDYKTNLGFDPDELASGVCQTLTITAAQASEQAFCVRDQSSQIPLKPPIAVTGSTNGPLSAKVDQESSGFWKFRLGSDEWLPGRGVMEIKLTITIDDLDAVGEARLLRMWFDDFAAASVNDNILFVGPWGGDRLDYDGRRVCWRGHRCTSRINLASAYDRWRTLGVDIKPYLRVGKNIVKARVVYSGKGRVILEGFLSASDDAKKRLELAEQLDKLPQETGCPDLEARGCFQSALAECLLEGPNGCIRRRYAYTCPGTDAEEIVDCGAARAQCTGKDCAQPGEDTSAQGDFVSAAVMLETSRQASRYLDPASLEVFVGTPSSCRNRAFGLGRCCRANSGGASNAATYAALAASVAKHGIRTAGSPYMYDSLFLSDNPNIISKLFPHGSAVSYTPGVSFYGIQMSFVSGGAPVFSFDPASFAVAVAILVAQNLLSCDQKEQLLALRRGRGLCVRVGSWCSRDTAVGCATEKDSYCCYNSKLARLIAAQGRPQLKRGWGKASRPDCSGFTEEELRQLDFSKMDFSEFVADISPTASDEVRKRAEESIRARAEKLANQDGKK